MTDRLIAERQGPIGWITFSNPERHNAMNMEMWQALPQALSAFEADDEVKVIVLRGAGDRAFVSGADISEFEKHRSSAEAVAAYEDLASSTMRGLQIIPKPTIAMIRGLLHRRRACHCDQLRSADRDRGLHLRHSGGAAWGRLPLRRRQAPARSGGTRLRQGNLLYRATFPGAGGVADGPDQPDDGRRRSGSRGR